LPKRRSSFLPGEVEITREPVVPDHLQEQEKSGFEHPKVIVDSHPSPSAAAFGTDAQFRHRERQETARRNQTKRRDSEKENKRADEH
jgi:hypothetical protein